MISLDNLRLKDIESGFMSRRVQFALVHTEQRFVSCHAWAWDRKKGLRLGLGVREGKPRRERERDIVFAGCLGLYLGRTPEEMFQRFMF